MKTNLRDEGNRGISQPRNKKSNFKYKWRKKGAIRRKK